MKGIVLITLFVFVLTGCAISPVIGAVNVTKWDGAIGDSDVADSRTGEACAQSILGLVATGDASITAAKRDGGISRIAYIEHKTTNVLHFYGQYCTIVVGE
ncbi:TRL-like family protein [Saccharospirillum mangrovi]|uniref:TRL-like family protein n=1 Tax=Saccharospirillum mangrovi TaxID=2161747 RepID=UPI000D3C20F5|nr:TRL-like family protein [Saccharospirillum mangrovi]